MFCIVATELEAIARTHAGRFVRFESFEFREPSKAFHV